MGQRPVCVLSVGRSGTSLATRFVNLLGLNLGPESSMLGACDHNPAGFWEQRALVWLNERILRTLGGTWSNPPARAPNWERSPQMGPFRLRTRNLVDEYFGDGRRWAFKDPRTTFTLPLWRSVVGEFDYVICMRNPLEVTASGLPPGDAGLRLWLHYSCEALRATVASRRTFVFYEDWFDDPGAVARSLTRFVNGDAAAADAVDLAAVVDPALHRQRASAHDLATRTDLPTPVRELVPLARQLAAAEAGGDHPRAHALQTRVATLDGGSGWR